MEAFDAEGGSDMEDADRVDKTHDDAKFSPGMTDQHRSAVVELLQVITEHVSAIQAAAHERLNATGGAGAFVPDEVRIEITTGAKPDRELLFDADLSTPYCWTETRPCGKTADGYIYCSVKICETTGPVVLSP